MTDEKLSRQKNRAGVLIKPLSLDWMTETERDVFGVPYMSREKETHASLNAGLGALDNHHIAPFLRIIDVAPIIEMAIMRLWELSITSNPKAMRQTKVILETAVKIPIKAALKHLPKELRQEVCAEVITELRGEPREDNKRRSGE